MKLANHQWLQNSRSYQHISTAAKRCYIFVHTFLCSCTISMIILLEVLFSPTCWNSPYPLHAFIALCIFTMTQACTKASCRDLKFCLSIHTRLVMASYNICYFLSTSITHADFLGLLH